LRNAAIAWSAPARSGNNQVTVYQMQWTNPRPDKVISSIDITYGPEGDRWGPPVILGITAATTR